jgi:chromatin remodeling complex protein RSC6
MAYSGWVLNTALTELTPELAETSLNKGKLRKELRAAFELAVEQHPLDFYKDILKKFEEETIKAQEAYEAAAATPKQSKKSKVKAVAAADEDEDMPDATESTKKTKKRKAEEDVNVSILGDSILSLPNALAYLLIRLPNGPTLSRSLRSNLIRPRRRRQPTEMEMEHPNQKTRLPKPPSLNPRKQRRALIRRLRPRKR